jgi:hypothetical protein
MPEKSRRSPRNHRLFTAVSCRACKSGAYGWVHELPEDPRGARGPFVLLVKP